MTDVQLYIALGIPIFANAVVVGLLVMYINARLDAMRTIINSLDRRLDTRFNAIDRRFDSIDKRFDDMRDLWRAELHRVEEVLDARLKHIEQERR